MVCIGALDRKRADSESIFIPGLWIVCPGMVTNRSVSLIIVVSEYIRSVMYCGDLQEASANTANTK